MPLYHLTDETMEHIEPGGRRVILHRIQADDNFYIRRCDPQTGSSRNELVVLGDLGGWVEQTYNLEGEPADPDQGGAWIDRHSIVLGSARIQDYALVENYSLVTGASIVGGDSWITGGGVHSGRITDSLIHSSRVGWEVPRDRPSISTVVRNASLRNSSIMAGTDVRGVYVQDFEATEELFIRRTDCETDRIYPRTASQPLPEPDFVSGGAGTPFGVEFECERVDSLNPDYPEVSRHRIAQLLNEAGVEAQPGDYSGREYHTTQVKHDGSLRDGVEVVTRILKWESLQAMSEIETICKILRDEGYRSAHRTCGCHVHIDLGTANPLNVVYAYVWAQKVIDESYISPSRSNANYAQHLDRYNIERAEEGSFNWDRSKVINPGWYSERGTFEFRQRNGTTLPRQIAEWIALLMSLISFAQAHDTDEMKLLSRMPATSKTQLLDALAPYTTEVTQAYLTRDVPALLV